MKGVIAPRTSEIGIGLYRTQCLGDIRILDGTTNEPIPSGRVFIQFSLMDRCFYLLSDFMYWGLNAP